jgi:hypothetical protein
MRIVRNLAATLAIASLAIVGCSKDEKNKSPEGAAAPGAASPAAQTAGAKSAFAVFTADTNLVVGINLDQIRASQLYKQFLEPMLKSQVDSEFAELKAECGFDPVNAIKEVVIGSTMSESMDAQEDKTIMVVKGLTRAQLSDCAAKMAKKEDKQIEVTQEGTFTKVVDKDGETVWIGWLDDNTMAMSPKMDKAQLEQRMSGAGGGLSGNKEMMDLVANTDQKAGLWLAMQKPAGAESPAGMDFQSVFASISLTGGIKVDAGVRQGSADEAKKTVGEATQKLEEIKTEAGPFGKYLSKVEISANNADVIVKMSLSDAEVNEILQTAGPLLGGMMGGGGGF